MASESASLSHTVPQAEDASILQSGGFYACPVCKQGLEVLQDGFSCRACARTYPIQRRDSRLHRCQPGREQEPIIAHHGEKDSHTLLNVLASTYERWVYPAVCNLYGGWRSTSLKQLAQDISDIVGSHGGLILDVACGPGTYGRRIASESRTVLGIDICMSMMRQGVQYVESDIFPTFTSPVPRWRRCRFGLASSTPPSARDR